MCIAKLGCVRSLHRTAQLRGHRLHAVTNAEQGHVETENKVWDDLVEKIVTFPTKAYLRDYEQQADFMNRMADWHKDYKKSLIDGVNAEPIYTCGDRLPDGSPTTAGAFLPVFAGEFTPANPTGTFSGHCFETINFEFEQTSTTSFDLHLDL